MRCGHRPSGTVPRPETRDASALIRRRSAVSAWSGVASGVSFRQGLRHASLWGVMARRKGFRVCLGMGTERSQCGQAACGRGRNCGEHLTAGRIPPRFLPSRHVLPVRADRMWICRIGTDSKFSSVYLRFISIFERGARVLSFPINPPKDERSRPFRRMDRAFRK